MIVYWFKESPFSEGFMGCPEPLFQPDWRLSDKAQLSTEILTLSINSYE
jgi:hypothetical protein